MSDNSAQYNFLENEFGLGNRLLIDAKTLQENLNAVQKAHALPQTEIDSAQAFPISVEMETGTGKTFVYTKTILELNNLYGFTKFIIVVPSVANGYFSQDKKGKYKDTKGDTLADDDTYNTIMKDKEWLLSFDCPLRFIFSHSALKEGWDNPNVFQVCTLIDQKSVFTCRQKVGRGLRLCVNQNGERIEDKDINILHVVANESFAEFAQKLQTEIETETGVKFGVLELSMLIGLTYDEEKEVQKEISPEIATIVIEDLQKSGVIDEQGSLKNEVAPEEIQLTSIPEAIKQEVVKTIKNEKTVSVAALASKTYTEKVVEKKVIDYHEAAQMIEDLKESKVIDKNGKIKDTMKAQLAAGTLNLDERYSKAAQRAMLQALNKADTKTIKGICITIPLPFSYLTVNFNPATHRKYSKKKGYFLTIFVFLAIFSRSNAIMLSREYKIFLPILIK